MPEKNATSTFSLKPDKRPLHGQAMNALLRLIEQGEYNPGDRLPGEIELSKILGVSRPTLREAMGNLETKGVIERRHGVGTFVSYPARKVIRGGLEQLESAKSLAEGVNIKAELGYRAVNLFSATQEIADILSLEEGTPLVRIQTTIRDDMRFFAYLDNYILADLVDIQKLEQFAQGSLLDFIIEQDEPKITYTYTNIHAIESNKEISNWLQIPEGSPLLLLTETYFTDTGKPVIFERNYFLTSFFNFRLIRQIVQPQLDELESLKQGRLIKPDQRPLYDQTIEALNRYIEQKKYRPGDRLPPEAELAQLLGISHTTLREAMGTLENQGIIERRHGVGAFVTAPARGRIQGGLEQQEGLARLAKNAGVDSKRVDWEISLIPSSNEVVRKLEVEPGSSIVYLQMTLKEGRGFFAYLESYVSPEFIQLDELKQFERGSLLDYLLEQGFPRLSHSITNLYAVAANKKMAQWLRIPRGKPLLLLEEVIYSDTGQPVELSYNHFITTHLNFHIIRRVVRNR